MNDYDEQQMDYAVVQVMNSIAMIACIVPEERPTPRTQTGHKMLMSARQYAEAEWS